MNHPIQPLEIDKHGSLRFKENHIVNDILEFSSRFGFGFNEIAIREYSKEDRQQFAQLIGYSLGGYGELSYVDEEAYRTAEKMANGADERDARIAVVEEKISELRAAIKMLREPMAILLEMHPDDLK